jgi:membrane-associated phospholipid phosphatase
LIRRLASVWAEDQRLALMRGAARDRVPNATSDAWLASIALTLLVLGTGLWALGGYHAGFERLNGAAAMLPPDLWQWLTVLGDERVAFALGLLAARRHPRVFWALICAGVVALAYARSLKPIFDAARPPAVLDPGSFNLIGPAHRSMGFPSGHSTTAGVLFGVFLYYAAGWGRRVLLLGLMLLAGISRVAIGVHWPVDVAFGLGGGMLSAWVGLRLARRFSWVIEDASVHLALVTLGVFVTIGLWFDDGGYAAAALPLRVLCVAVVGYTALVYLLLPGWRVLRRARDSAPTAI